MFETFDEFKKEFIDEIRINAQIEGYLPEDYFITYMTEKLVNMGELVDPRIVSMQKRCRNNRIMSIDGYAFDDSDKSIILFISDYKEDDNSNLTESEIEQLQNKMLYFLEEAFDGKLSTYFDLSDELLLIGNDIGKRMKIDYVDLINDNSIDKIKLYIFTNRNLSKKMKTLPFKKYLSKQIETNIWGIERLFDLYQSGKDKEPIIIKTEKYGFSGIPCIKAEMSGNLDYDAYLAIVPGDFLNRIYYEHGSRLLEGNVRAFLSNRGKINKGIRETIRKEPTKFFTYNNGIACTASRIILSNDGHQIIEMEDLQIINGGQTTASLASAFLKDKMSLDNIFVPMKLTVIKNEDYESMIQNISKYANSQNKVKDSDLFSNHAFHRLFEALSKKIQAPIVNNAINGTYWYYERSRGKFEQEQFKFTKKSEKENFLKKYPKHQVIKKEELAKYFTSADLLRPDAVSRGSEKCMSFFAEYISNKFETNPNHFNDEFYKMCICYAILFRTTDNIVNKASWYNKGGYKLNIVPYTISKLIYSIPRGYCLDFDRIWKKQSLYPSLIEELEKIAFTTNEFVQNSSGIIVTEYCKKEETWNKYKAIKHQLNEEFINDLISKEFYEEKMKSSQKDKKVENELNKERIIYEKPPHYWEGLIRQGKERNLLSTMEIDIMSMILTFNTSRPKFPSPKQIKIILAAREKLEKNGVLV